MSDVPASSQLARLRAKAAAARQAQHVDCHLEPVGVVVRYGPLTTDQIDDVRRRGKSGARENVSVLVEACQAVLIVDDDGQLVSIDPDATCFVDSDGVLQGDPVTFSSSRLAELLEADSAAGLVDMLYGLAGRSLQIARDADDVIYLSRGETRRMSRPMRAGSGR